MTVDFLLILKLYQQNQELFLVLLQQLLKLIAPEPKTPLAKPNKPAKQTETDHAKSERYAGISLSTSYMSAILADGFTNSILPDTKISEVTSALKAKIETVQAVI